MDKKDYEKFNLVEVKTTIELGKVEFGIEKNYPYLIKTIDKVKNNYTIYVEIEDLPCIEKVEQKPIEKPKEEIKETQKTIEEKKE